MNRTLADEIHKESVTFSKQARSPSALPNIYRWWNVAKNVLLMDPTDSNLGASRIPKGMTGMQTVLGKDPFWFLWAAPYVTAGFPRGAASGGAVQED